MRAQSLADKLANAARRSAQLTAASFSGLAIQLSLRIAPCMERASCPASDVCVKWR